MQIVPSVRKPTYPVGAAGSGGGDGDGLGLGLGLGLEGTPGLGEVLGLVDTGSATSTVAQSAATSKPASSDASLLVAPGTRETHPVRACIERREGERFFMLPLDWRMPIPQGRYASRPLKSKLVSRSTSTHRCQQVSNSCRAFGKGVRRPGEGGGGSGTGTRACRLSRSKTCPLKASQCRSRSVPSTQGLCEM